MIKCEIAMRNAKVKGKPILTKCTDKAVAVIRAYGKEYFACKRHKNTGIFVRNI